MGVLSLAGAEAVPAAALRALWLAAALYKVEDSVVNATMVVVVRKVK